MRVVFMGTPDFAVPCLESLVTSHQVVAVVTQPDRRKGRGQQVTFSPVKEKALQEGIPVHQPDKVNTEDFIATLRGLEPDVIVVVAFGQKIPSEILSLPPKGCINVHSSLLPAYRGAAPIHRAIVNGEEKTGVSTMYLSEQWDAGDVILQEVEPIMPEDTAGSLHDRLKIKGAQLLKKTLDLLAIDQAPRIPQDHSNATYAFKLTKTDGLIDWSKAAVELECLIRGMNPWPVAYTYFEGEQIKVWDTKTIPGDTQGSVGEVMEIFEEGPVIVTGEGRLCIRQAQRPNSKRISGKDLVNGLRLTVGSKFSGVDTL